MKPVLPTDFGLAQHRYHQFDCTVTADQAEQIESGELWSNIAHQLQQGDHVRAVVDDYSKVYFLFVTFVSGTQVRVRKLSEHKLDKVDQNASDQDEVLSISMRGPKKWCLVDTRSGQIIAEGIPTKAEAVKQQEEYREILGI